MKHTRKELKAMIELRDQQLRGADKRISDLELESCKIEFLTTSIETLNKRMQSMQDKMNLIRDLVR